MKYLIRNYEDCDFQMIKSWWDAADVQAPNRALMPKETTFILELDGKPVMTLALFITNSFGMAYIENFVAAPDFKSSVRKKASKVLFDHILNFAKKLGYHRVCMFAYNDKLANRYTELGMNKTLNNVTTFAKEL
jgi:hypothetical protein